VFPVKYELGFYIPEEDILTSHLAYNFALKKGAAACFSEECAKIYRIIRNQRTLCTSNGGIFFSNFELDV
jgi:hypothetical protein